MMKHPNRFLITGATGLIGSAIVARLLSDDNNIVICPVRDRVKASNLFSGLNCNYTGRLTIIECQLEVFLEKLDLDVDYIIHCASPTSSRYFVERPVETILFGLKTTASILEFAKNREIKSIVYLSSLEVYGTVTDDTNSITEDYQGYVDLMNVRSSYNMTKRMCENLCHSYFKEYNIPVKIVRPTQVISPVISESDNRIFAQFGRKAAAGEDIELHTIGDSARQYIYIDDAVEGIMTVLMNGEDGKAYNLADESSYISAREMAEFIQYNFNPKGVVKLNLRDDMGYAPTTKLKLDTTELKNLGWSPKFGLYDMFSKLIKNLKSE